MHRRLLFAIATVVVALAMFTATASAFGPAAPGKILVFVTCNRAGAENGVWVTVQRADTNGAGQDVAAYPGDPNPLLGLGITVSSLLNVYDDTTGTPAWSSFSAVGNGHAHANQTIITCVGTLLAGQPASDFFDSVPPGASFSLADIITVTISVDIVPQTRGPVPVIPL